MSAPLDQTRTVRKGEELDLAKLEQDEWGFFDPEEGGFSALVTKLDQLSTHK